MLCRRFADAVTDSGIFSPGIAKIAPSSYAYVSDRARKRSPGTWSSPSNAAGQAARQHSSANSATRLLLRRRPLDFARGRPQFRGLVGIMSVQVLQETHPSIMHPCGLIKDVDGDLCLQLDVFLLSRFHGGVNGLRRPFRLIAEHVLRELVRLFDAHAAVAQAALDA